MQRRRDRKQRNVILGSEIDTLLDQQAARDGITVTQAIQRAVLVREDILRMAAHPSRLALIRDPDLAVPTGVEVFRLVGSW